MDKSPHKPAPLDDMRLLQTAMDGGRNHARSIQGGRQDVTSAIPLPGKGIRLEVLFMAVLHIICLAALSHCLHLRSMPPMVPIEARVTHIRAVSVFLDIDEEASRVGPGRDVIGMIGLSDLPAGIREDDRVTLFARQDEAQHAADASILPLYADDSADSANRFTLSVTLAWAFLILADLFCLIRRRREKA